MEELGSTPNWPIPGESINLVGTPFVLAPVSFPSPPHSFLSHSSFSSLKPSMELE